ncbi:MAG: T9SS type A sorting domain-containing protein [Chitinophagaceae bacterium]
MRTALCILVLSFGSRFGASAQTVLFDYHFNTSPLPTGITSDGTISTTKTADGVCTAGAETVIQGGYLQADVASCSVFNVNMKSTGGSVRTVSVKYKKDGEPGYTTVSTTLTVQAAATFNFATLFPAIVSSGPVSVRIEPTAGNIQIHDLYVLSNNTVSTAAEITAFKLTGQTGSEVINSAAGTIAINVPLGTTLNPVAPQTVTISPLSTISPLGTTAQNFSSPVNYAVTAQDGTTIKNWTVNVTQVASAAKEITAFKLSNSQIGSATINSGAGTIAVNMPLGSTLTGLVPVTLSLSANASVNPGAATAQDFSGPVVYTVTAQDNSTKGWTVTVALIDPNLVFTDYEAEQAYFTGTVDNNHLNYTGTGFINFLAGGENSMIFSVCQTQAGDRTAKFRYSLANDTYRKGNLFVNDVFIKLLDFPRTATFDDWANETVVLTLPAGLNNIKITWDTTDGPNLDKLQLSGAPCNSYTLGVTATNGGVVTKSPARTNNKYFEGETVTLLAETTPALTFSNWSGDLTGSVNPSVITMNANKTIVANFAVVPTYKLNISVTGVGGVSLNPEGGEYAANTVVTLTANPILGSTFAGWGGALSGSNPVQMITMDAVKNVTATFNSAITIDFEKVIGFASITADGFTGPTKGGQCAPDTLTINGPAEFNKLCESLYNRQQAYKTNNTVNGMKKAPLVIILKAGIYDGSQTLTTTGAKIFGNYMMDIPEQGDLSVVGESNVVWKIGINVKRSYNLLIRNIFFQDYYDDGINIGYSETHHIWVDHCTIGSPIGFPLDSEHPDGGCDIKDGASYITVSWCLFRNSWKTSLNGHSDNNGATDLGRLKITYVNNHFMHTNSRNPRVRFGQVHVLNNLLDNVQLYGSVAANTAQVFCENNFYLNTDWPMYADRSVADFKAVYGNNNDNTYTSKTGNYPCVGLKQTGNAYDDSGLPVITAQINPAMLNPGGRSIKFDELNPAGVFTPSSYYAYTPMAAADVRVLIPLFAGADKVTFASCSALPLQLLSFDAILNGSAVKATWQTDNEVNTREFEVDRSVNGRDFVSVGIVASKNTSGLNSYSFTDVNPAAGINWYRLKMIDKDGKFTLSRTVTVNGKNSVGLRTFPNPVVNTLSVAHPRAVSGAVIKIVAADGRMTQSVNCSIGANSTLLTLSSLPSGNYLVIMQNGTERMVTKFVKQ